LRIKREVDDCAQHPQNDGKDRVTDQPPLLKAIVHTGISDFYDLQDSWNQVFENSPESTFFNSFAWTESWIFCYWKPVYSAHIVVILQNGEPVALLPFYFNVDYRKWMLLGTGEPESGEVATEYVDFLVSSKLEDKDEIDRIISKELEPLLNRGIEIRNCMASSHIYRFAKLYKNSVFRRCGSKFQLNLNASFDEILQSFSKNHRKKTREILNRFSNRPELTFLPPCEKNFEENWSLLQELHTHDWQRKGKPGAFYAESFDKFHRHMYRNYPEIKQLFASLKFNDKPIAVNFYYEFRNVLYYYQSGSDKQQYGQLSPGILLHTLCIDSLCNELLVYDFLKGPLGTTYKEKFTSRGENFYNITMYGSTPWQSVAFQLRILFDYSISIFRKVRNKSRTNQ